MIKDILIVYSLAYLISESNLLTKPREWLASKHRLIGELIYCPICLSFWIALIHTSYVEDALITMGAIALLHKFMVK